MKSKIIISLIIIGMVAFSYGVLVGHYQIFPFSILSEIKNNQSERTTETNVEIYQETSSIQNLISFETVSDIEITKQKLIEFIWIDSKLPKNIFPKYDVDIDDPI